MSDLIDRQAAIDALADMHCKSDEDGYVWIIRSDAWARIDALPSVQPEKRTEERTETHACDLIDRQAAIDVADAVWSVTGDINVAKVWDQIKDLPSAQTELEKKTGKEGLIDILTRRHDALVAVWMTADTPEQYKLAREIGAIEKMLRLYGAM